MCGLVGVAGSIIAGDAAIFKQLMFMDTIRGKHATGIALTGMPHAEPETFKMAIAAPYFLEQPPVAELLSAFQYNCVVMGHNRHATKGANGDPLGAHPFVHGHITLMHNGSLTTHYSLTKETFTVDSEAICRAFEVEGALNVIPKLNGAFALTWIDSKEGTLNFVRNDERPLCIGSVANKIYWASERGMLEWMLSRPSSVFSDTPTVAGVTYKELPVGVLYSIPITPTGLDLANSTVTEVDIAPQFSGGYAPHNRKKLPTPTNTTTRHPGLTTSSSSATSLARWQPLVSIRQGILPQTLA